ncbi:hypothetical protein [Sinorhizobium meliloti]|uniref:hypothetical protein n=1 Tax=Rhizobium meliloti TaxID=382 RepID=UPI000D1F56C0|nr:hypothetical protein [Sinorhizobium meliloti]RMI15680.1 hypothetical protein DA102_026715 [Sinorhizobium meliloti]
MATLVKNRGVARDFTDLAWACRSTTVEEPFQAIHYAILDAQIGNKHSTGHGKPVTSKTIDGRDYLFGKHSDLLAGDWLFTSVALSLKIAIK